MGRKILYIEHMVGISGLFGCQKLELGPNEFVPHTKAYDAGDGQKCYCAGLMYEQGIGVRKNNYTASKSYKAGCEIGNKSSCTKLGDLYKEGCLDFKRIEINANQLIN